MRNRAKCKLCGDIIESFFLNDYVTCKCGEISVDGGNQYYKASAKNFNNFLRVDDNGNEIVVDFQSNEPVKEEKIQQKPSRKEMLDMLDELCNRINNLPVNAMLDPITHADFASLIMLLSSILRAE